MASESAPRLPYVIVQPPGWLRIPLDDSSDAVVREAVERSVAGAPATLRPRFRAFLLQQFAENIAEARGAGGLDLFLPVEPVNGIAIPMSIVTAVAPAPDSGAEDPTTDALLAFAAGNGDAQATTAGAQLAVRTSTDTPAQLDADGRVAMPANRTINYLVATPFRGALLAITGSIQVLEVEAADELVEASELLFDAMVRTLRFQIAPGAEEAVA